MSWLYERREQLDGLRPFVEIAHRLIYPVPHHDRDDVEQEIVITLKRVTDRRGEVGENYLWGAARNVVRHLLAQKIPPGEKVSSSYREQQGRDGRRDLDVCLRGWG